MTTTQIKYSKVLDIVKEDLNSGVTTQSTRKISDLESVISGLECFSIRLDNSKLYKTIKRIKALGFQVEVDENFGFDWECKLYCDTSLNY